MRIDIDHLTLPEPEAVLLLKAEVQRLRGVITALADQDATMTDDEREAVEFFGAMSWPPSSLQCKARSATLRGLLERTQ